jgi:hypothetical protein
VIAAALDGSFGGVRIRLRDRVRFRVVARGRVEYVKTSSGAVVPTLHPRPPMLRRTDELRVDDYEYAVLRRRRL